MNRFIKAAEKSSHLVGPRRSLVYSTSQVVTTFDSKSLQQTASNTSSSENNSEKVVDYGITLLKGIFAVSDAIAYIPNKMSGKASKRLEACASIKAAPVQANNPSGPWRNLNVLKGELVTRMYPDCSNLYQMWQKTCQDKLTQQIIGVREVKQIIGTQLVLGQYNWLTYQQINAQITKIANGLRNLDLVKGDKVVIFAETRYEWLMTAIACFKEGFPLVTIYSTLGEKALAHAINETGGKVLVTNENQLKKIQQVGGQIGSIRKIVCFEDRFEADKKELIDINGIPTERYEQFLKNSFAPTKQTNTTDIKEDDLAVLMYTSGTSSLPKGVKLSHGNIMSGLKGLRAYEGLGGFLDRPNDIFCCFLPTAHVFELAIELQCLMSGVKMGYSSPSTLTDSPRIHPSCQSDLACLKPTTMIVVPAILNKLRSAVEDKLALLPNWFRKVLDVCYERKSDKYDVGLDTPFLDLFIFNKFKKVLGGNVNRITCGGAPLDPDTQRFTKMCFAPHCDLGWGMTESVAVGTFNHPHDRKEGSAGVPMDSLEIILKPWAEGKYFPTNEKAQGEICIHGPNVFQGYFNRDSEDDFIEINGKRYFMTGDIGEFCPQGNLSIIDRKKDLSKLACGEYVALGKVESKLMANSFVDNVCVVAKSSMSYCLALVVANKTSILQLGKQLGIKGSFEELCNNEMIINFVRDDIAESMESTLKKFETPKKVVLLSSAWTPANGLVTDALKLKRRIIEERFADQIDTRLL
uniref:AMP-binding domain-containing protein n=1 Tax=Rhabditophanes sp. KR3021 TaxID=114890 RepID=A0AC35TXE3_9BILA